MDYLERMNAPTSGERLAALREYAEGVKAGKVSLPPYEQNANNHIHTTYSFSPYSPTKAACMARLNGLPTAGIMDHDSIGGAAEFYQAGKIIGIATTSGIEIRCSLKDTPFEGKKTNNPDQNGITYLTVHGVPQRSVAAVQAFITPYREQRGIRNRKMTGRLNGVVDCCGVTLDYDKDILPLSQAHDGGTVTERHILYALSRKMLALTGGGQPLLDLLGQKLDIQVTGGVRDKLLDPDNTMQDYYLLGVFKSHLVEHFYIDADAECPHITDFVKMAKEAGAIPCYSYLGDVIGESVTGDKKTQTFEDPYLDELVEFVSSLGFQGFTYMPTRNTQEQLRRVMALCEKHGLFQISGEDINTPFQPFLCPALEQPEFHHLITSTWALIGHERMVDRDPDGGMFSPGIIQAMPDLQERIQHFAAIGRKEL